MNSILLVSITLRLIAIIWSVKLLLRTKDWRLVVLVAMFGFMALRQILTHSFILTDTGFFHPDHLTELPGLIVSLLSLLVIYFLDRIFFERELVETSLTHEEEKYRVLLDATTSVTWTTDESGGFVTRQISWEKYTGQTWDEYKDYGWTKKIHPEDIEQILSTWNAARREKSFYETSGRIWNARLECWRNFDAKATPIINDNGSLREWVGIIIDVTERKQIEDTLNFTQFAIDRAVDPAFWMRSDGTLRYVNDAACNMLDYSKEELLSMTAHDIDPNFTSEQWPKLWQILKSDKYRTIESEARRKDGTLVPVEVTSYYLEYQGQDFICAFSRDISSRKKIERDLEFMTFAIDRVGIPAYWMRADSSFFYVNDAACESLGYTREELLTMSVPDIDPDFPRDIWPGVWKELQKKKYQYIETRHRKKDGTVFPVEISSNYLEYMGQEYNCAFSRDITERKQAEKTLQENEANLREAEAMSRTGNWEWHIKTGKFRMSEGMYRVYGIDPENTIISHIDEIMEYAPWPEDNERHKVVLQRAIENREPGSIEHRFLRPDKNIGYLYSTFQGIYDEQGQLISIKGTIQDITERKAVEQELRDSESRLREAQAMSHIGNWYWDIKTGEVDWSDEVYRIFWLDPEKFTPQIDSIMALSPWPGDNERHNEIIQRALDNHEPGSFEQRFLRPDKSIGYYFSTFQGIYDEQVNVIAMKGTVQDITERKEIENALRQSEDKYRTLIELSPYCVHQIDADGRLISMNQAGLELLNKKKESEIVGKAYLDSVSDEDRGHISKIMNDAFSGEFQEFEFRSVNGLVLQSNFVPVYNPDGNVYRLLGITQDITERKQAEILLKQAHADLEKRVVERTRDLELARKAAEAANLAKSQFLANMSHELRTPLNATIGYSELIIEEATANGDIRYIPDLENINAASKHLLSLINDILDLSKIEAGKMDIFVESIDVTSLINDVKAVTLTQIENQGNQLVVNCPGNIGKVKSDLTRVKQILFNLLSNAAKFTKGGVITLDVKRNTKNRKKWLTFIVTDTGIGMTPEQQTQVFGSFKQADLSTTRKYGGTGLGLTLCKSLCEILGGTIHLESTPGEGSVFTVMIPEITV